MSDNWVVQNLENALETWNEKLAEIWTLVTQSPQAFKGGTIWNVMVGIHGAVKAIGLALIVLFFVMGVMKTCGSFADLKRPEVAVKVFVRFALAKTAVTHGLELMNALFSIAQGLVSTIMSAAGFGSAQTMILPTEIVTAVEDCGFFESIPLWAVTLIGGLLITVLSFVMIMTVYITWAMNKYGEYTKANAVEFSINVAERYGWSSYGDMNYVPHVLRYYPLGQIFYAPDTSELIVEVAASQIGNVGGEPYWSWYGFTERVEWCACFVSWCADKCGYIDAGIIPKFSGCIDGVQWFKDRGQWIGNSFEPSPGMIIFFDWEDESDGGGLDGLPDHVGIVEKVENGRVYTIEGNTSDSCREQSYPVGYFEILGYGIPVYQNSVKPF